MEQFSVEHIFGGTENKSSSDFEHIQESFMHCFSDLSHATLDYSYREMFSASWLDREWEF